MSWKIILLLITILLSKEEIVACHKGGPMGFATNDPGAFSLDITISPTYTGASTSGTAGCKDWDYSHQQRKFFLETQWSYLSEDVARGKGDHLSAFTKIMGCENERSIQFASLIREHYSALFKKNEGESNNLLRRFEIFLLENQNLSCSG